MRILADENCDRLIVTMLRHAGHDVAFVTEDENGIEDTRVLLRARDEKRAILTDDLDFGHLFEREQSLAPTIFLIRIGAGNRQARATRVCEVVCAYDGPDTGQLLVIEASQLRRRSYK